MTLIADCLTSHDEMERCFSSYGVTAFSDHNRSGVKDDDVVDDCANQAHSEFCDYATARYSVAALTTHQTARRWATLMACYFLSIRRGNAAPDGLQIEFTRITEKLPQIATGEYKLNGLALRGDLRPTFSNVQVDRRHRHSTIRVTQPNSSNAPTTLSQDFKIEGPVAHD
jgi:phage gp36-like protein